MQSYLQMQWSLKEVLEAGSWLAAIVGGIVVALKFGTELRQGREQRAKDLRWRQAQAGKALNDEMLDDPEAAVALQMLDFDGRAFKFPSGDVHRVSHDQVRRILDPRNENKDLSQNDLYVRDCFDGLFYYFATLEHYVRSTLVLRDDIAFPLDYYVPLLTRLLPEVERYLDHFGLERSKAFLSRYEKWRERTSPPRTDEARRA
jgi:hypothetical protein